MSTMSNTGAAYLKGAGQGQVPQWQGAYAGYIAVNQDPTDQGRVKLRVPQVFGGTTSGWASPMVPVQYIPPVGTPVLVMFVGGDPSQPVWFGNFALPGAGQGVTTGTGTPNPSPAPAPPVGTIYYQLNGSGVIIAMWEWNGSGWVDYFIGGSAVATGTLTAANIQPASLTSSVIGNLGAILNANPYFAGNSAANWLGTFGVSSTTSPPAGALYPYALTMTSSTGAGGNCAEGATTKAPVVPGGKYIVTGWLYSTSAAGTVNIGANWFLNGSYVSSTNIAVTALPANTWTFVQGIIDAPASGVNGMGEYFAFPANGSTAWTAYVQAAQVLPQIPGVVDATTINGSTINGSAFNGADFVINSSGAFFYSGTPAYGNLLLSIANTAGTDGFGNAYNQGAVLYGANGSSVAFFDNSGTPALWLTPGLSPALRF